MAETLSNEKRILNEWREFSKTLAYQELIKFINLQKEINSILASGPMEVYRSVPTLDGREDLQFDFEPEKYAYLLQRSVGCDIVKTYVEDYVNPTTLQKKN
jgi:hypothetical protein